MSKEITNESQKKEIFDKSKKALINDDHLESVIGGYSYNVPAYCEKCRMPKKECKCGVPYVEMV